MGSMQLAISLLTQCQRVKEVSILRSLGHCSMGPFECFRVFVTFKKNNCQGVEIVTLCFINIHSQAGEGQGFIYAALSLVNKGKLIKGFHSLRKWHFGYGEGLPILVYG